MGTEKRVCSQKLFSKNFSAARFAQRTEQGKGFLKKGFWVTNFFSVKLTSKVGFFSIAGTDVPQLLTVLRCFGETVCENWKPQWFVCAWVDGWLFLWTCPLETIKFLCFSFCFSGSNPCKGNCCHFAFRIGLCRYQFPWQKKVKTIVGTVPGIVITFFLSRKLVRKRF